MIPDEAGFSEREIEPLVAEGARADPAEPPTKA